MKGQLLLTRAVKQVCPDKQKKQCKDTTLTFCCSAAETTCWTGVYDCIFFTMNQELYDSFSPEMQALIDEAGAYAANNQRQLEREGDKEVLAKWEKGGMTVSYLSDEAVKDFKDAASGVPAKFVQTCVGLGFDQAQVEQIVSIFVEG